MLYYFYHQSNNSVSVFELTLQTDFFHHGRWKCFNHHCQSKRPLPLPSWSFPGKKEVTDSAWISVCQQHTVTQE